MIRLATIEDVDNLVKFRIQLLKETNKNTLNYDWDKYAESLKYYFLDALVNGKAVAFMAEKKSVIIGISIMCFYDIVPLIFNLEGKMALLTDMYINLEYRNEGLGTELLKNIMEHTKKLGHPKVILNATDSGRGLYKRFGFKDITGEMSYKFMEA